MSFTPSPTLIILFVRDPLKSSAFYGRLFGLDPLEQSETFVMFSLPNGMMLGLWSPLTAEPPAVVNPGGNEICFKEENLDDLYAHWVKLGITIAQPPTEMDFGRTFVGLDPDGHRLRVYRLRDA